MSAELVLARLWLELQPHMMFVYVCVLAILLRWSGARVLEYIQRFYQFLKESV